MYKNYAYTLENYAHSIENAHGVIGIIFIIIGILAFVGSLGSNVVVGILAFIVFGVLAWAIFSSGKVLAAFVGAFATICLSTGNTAEKVENMEETFNKIDSIEKNVASIKTDVYNIKTKDLPNNGVPTSAYNNDLPNI